MSPSLQWAIETLSNLSTMGYSGKIELNFNLGGITGVNLSQSLKPMTEIRINIIGRELTI